MARLLPVVAPLAVLLAGACGTHDRRPTGPQELPSSALEDAPDGGDADGPSVSDVDGGPTTAEVGPAGAGQRDAAVPEPVFGNTRPPRLNVSFESAKLLEVDAQPSLQDVVQSAQVDYYRFTAKRGGYYEVTTDRHMFSPDLVVSLHNADYDLIGQNDQGSRWPGDAIDARLVVRASEDGDLFVRVEDPWTPPEFFQGSFTLLYYHVAVRELTDAVPGVAVVDGSDPVEVTTVVDDASGLAYVTLLGEFHDEPDVFELSGGVDEVLVGEVLASGEEGNGSTAFGGTVRVVDAQSQLLAEIDRDTGQAFVAPPVGDERVRVQIVGASELGDNPFYAVNVVLAPDSPAEQDDVANGEPAGAEHLDFTSGSRRRAVVRLTLPPGDVDHIGFEASAGEFVDVDCEGESAGSGVRALSVELLDASDQVLADASETHVERLKISRAAVGETGEYFLRLSSATPEGADTAVPWLRCSVLVGP